MKTKDTINLEEAYRNVKQRWEDRDILRTLQQYISQDITSLSSKSSSTTYTVTLEALIKFANACQHIPVRGDVGKWQSEPGQMRHGESGW